MISEELITKLEAAEVPSQALDREIARIIGWHRVEPRHHRSRGGKGKGGWIAPRDWLGAHSDGSPILDSLHGTTIYPDVPHFTTSIDAAMTLVPEGFAIDTFVIWPNNKPMISIIGTTLINGHFWHEAGRDGRWPAEGATPAIALCVAALKARR